jgi:F-type H+-transporting ATPase subunit b
MQIVSNIALISINETLIVQLISFLIFLFVINRLMIRPLRTAQTEREFYIERILRGMSAAETEIEDLARQVHRQENKAISAARRISGELEDAGKQEAEAILSVAHQEAEKISRETDRKIKDLLAEARRSVQQEADALALGMMEKLLDRRLGS